MTAFCYVISKSHTEEALKTVFVRFPSRRGGRLHDSGCGWFAAILQNKILEKNTLLRFFTLAWKPTKMPAFANPPHTA